MSHFECHSIWRFWRSKKVVQVFQNWGEGGGGGEEEGGIWTKSKRTAVVFGNHSLSICIFPCLSVHIILATPFHHTILIWCHLSNCPPATIFPSPWYFPPLPSLSSSPPQKIYLPSPNVFPLYPLRFSSFPAKKCIFLRQIFQCQTILCRPDMSTVVR